MGDEVFPPLMQGQRPGVLARLAIALMRLRIRRGLRSPSSSDVLDHYVTGTPTHQNAIDSVPGWTGAMPSETGLRAGKAPLFADTRIFWLLQQCVDVAGKTVLELGPLEGFHTYMVDRAGAASIDAVEANALAFVRCLITKEVLGVSHAHFFLGDFMSWLESTEKRYDLVIASGVLYHSQDPVRLLELIGRKADAIFLWTHFFDEGAMPKGDLRRTPFSEVVEIKSVNGVTVRLHERSYYKAWRDPAFCGGMQDRHFWIDRADILNLLAAMGFSRIMIADEQPDHQNGPSFSVFAERLPAPVSQAGPEQPAQEGNAAEASVPDAPLAGGGERVEPPSSVAEPHLDLATQAATIV